MFGIGGFELFIILVFGFLVFGPDKLPEIAKTLGRGIAKFREAQAEVNDTLGGEKLFDPNNPDEPFKDPVEVLDRLAQRQEDKKAGKAPAAERKGPAPAQDRASSTASQPAASAPKQESFTERKARYERERAARKAEEQARAQREAEAGTADAFSDTPDALAARLEQEAVGRPPATSSQGRPASPKGGE